MSLTTPTSSRPSHVFTATVLTFWLTTHQLFSQSRETAFGALHTYNMPEYVEHLRLVYKPKENAHILFLWSARSSVLYSAPLPLRDQRVVYRVQHTTMPFDDLDVADVTGDGVDDIILVHREDKTISVVTKTDEDSLRPSATLKLPLQPTEVLLGDINHDGRLDLLVANRTNPGIIPFLGQGRGKFRQGSVIAPDNAVSQMALVYLNNDLLPDLVFYDWVKSELHIAYGIGRGRFLDLTALRVEGVVDQLLATRLSPRSVVDLLLVLRQPNELQLWSGDVTGEFHRGPSFALTAVPIACEVADVDNDGWKDIVLLEEKHTMSVILNPLQGLNAGRLEYWVGQEARNVVLVDADGDTQMDALVLKSNQLLVFDHALHNHELKDSLQLATGIEPRGLWIGDLNGDGINDLMAVCTGSNALSLFVGRSEGGLTGQRMLPVAVAPKHVTYHSASTLSMNFVVSYPSTQSISFLSIHRNDFSTVNALIPGVGEMEVLSVGSQKQRREFFCYNLTGGARSPSLVFYQQLEQKSFIERTFRLSIPDVLLGAAVDDINHDGYTDIAFAYRNQEQNRNELIISLGDSSLSLKNRHQVLALPDGNLRKSYLWFHDFDGNDTVDVLMVFPQTLKTMMLARGTANRTFQQPVAIMENVSLSDRTHLQIIDFDGDGVSDIVFYNSATNTLGWLKGMGGGTFSDWRALLYLPAMNAFALGDVNSDGILDVAVTVGSAGVVNIYNGSLWLGKKP